MVKTAELFQSGMILQRDKTVPVWGTAEPGERVRVTVQGKTAEGQADENGRWSVELPPLTASEEEQMTVSGTSGRITFDRVAVGEVWLAGGQSNMEYHMRYEKHLSQVKPTCENPRIRFFDVPEIAFDGQGECFDYSRMGRWRSASPEEIEYFSAVGYYFERAVEKALDVPVGIVGCNWGGTVSAAWMDPETVRQTGPVWMKEYEAFLADTKMEEYWEKQKKSPLNIGGNPFADPFSELVMPRTPSPEEMGAFFASMQASGDFPDPQDFIDSFLPQNIPGALYEHMLKAVAPFAVRGVLWYQGESDDEMHHADLYASMLTALIGDWRKLWKEELPFLIVQLPGFESWLQVACDRFDLIRAAQEQVSDQVPGVYLCSISDAGEQYDIHPKDKQVVGERLALLARGHVYGENLLCDAPRAREATREGKEITLRFEHAEGGLVLRGETVSALRVTVGEKELPFQASVSGETLRIRLTEDTPGPVRVDFAQEKFYLVDLYNQSGIPAVPFSLVV